MSRLPSLPPDQLSPQQLELYQAIIGGPRGGAGFQAMNPDGSLAGPFNALLFAPVVGDALQRLGSAVRYGTALSDRVREMAILVVAAHWDSAHERSAHERVGRQVGLTEPDLVALREHRAVAGADATEALALRVVRELVGTGDLDDNTWAAGVAELGLPALVELTALVGYYSTLALQLRVFRVGPADSDPT